VVKHYNAQNIIFHIICKICIKIDQERVIMPYRRFMCLLCGFIYDEEKGWPEDGIAAGTRWEDVPMAWQCPECGATKDDFEMIEIVNN